MNRFLVPLGFLAALVIAVTLWWFMPEMIGAYGEQMKKAGFLVPALIMLLILQISFVVERLLSLRKAQGRGSAANVMRAGLERYSALRAENAPKEKIVAETQAAIQEASGLETPLLERNLIALSTIASISTMVGLLGTVLGMIRSFAALGTSGAVDASKLAVGISEALVNTAGGLFVAILGIVMYNVFVTRVDNFNYMMDEASYEVLQLLAASASDKK